MMIKKVIRALPTVFAVVTSGFFLLPIILVVFNSLMSSGEVNSLYAASNDYAVLRFIPKMTTIEQYYRVMIEDPAYLIVFWNSMRMVVPIVAGQVFFASLAAYALSCFEFKGREVIFFIYVAVMLMPSQATIVPNFIMVRRLGLIDTFQAVIFPGMFGAFGVVLLRQFMLAVPREYIEAARLEGSGFIRVLFQIVIPLVKGGFVSVIILCFVDNWGMVETPLVFLSDKTMSPISVFLSGAGMSGELFAASVLAMTPPLLLFLVGRDELVKGIELSGLK
ncbi:MAG: carbohydrate ABC transporter permease [Eubacteriales bacterium]|jgi:multiple sugar transport system permease protein